MHFKAGFLWKGVNDIVTVGIVTPKPGDDSSSGESTDDRSSDEDCENHDAPPCTSASSAARGKSAAAAAAATTNRKKQTWKTVKQQNSAKIPLWPGALPDSDAIGLPIHYFRVFFDADRLDNVVEQSNLYSTQQNPTKLDQNELEQFIGAVVYMSDFHLRRSRMYRSSGCQVPQVADTMSRDRWEQI